jgi:hypothetical protein
MELDIRSVEERIKLNFNKFHPLFSFRGKITVGEDYWFRDEISMEFNPFKSIYRVLTYINMETTPIFEGLSDEQAINYFNNTVKQYQNGHQQSSS